MAVGINTTNKKILDSSSGLRMFYFDKKDERVLVGDIREEEPILCDSRSLKINPDIQLDFSQLPFDDNSFKLVVFDPSHLKKAGKNGWQGLKYSVLNENWQEDLKQGFKEYFRVLELHGVLIFNGGDPSWTIFWVKKSLKALLRISLELSLFFCLNWKN